MSAAAAARTEEQRFEYKRREPQSQVLHRLVREHLEPFLEYTRERYRKPLPKYVERELRGLLRCGDPWHGFTRVRCPRCRHEFFVAFSCGARTVCPSCSGRRMAAASVHLTDRVLPDAPVRQYVLSAPYELRLLLASRSEVLSAVIRIVMRVLLGWYRRRGRALGLQEAETGAVSFVQRFGASMNCHTHLHVIVIDGVFSRQEGGTTRFHFVEPPSAQELASMVATICERVCRMLRRRGLMGEASLDSNEVRLPEEALDGCRTVALSRGRFERLDEQGRAQQRLFADDDQGMRRKKDARWSADCRGFSLHAGVGFGALDRKGRERLVRYCTRPPLATERLSVLRDGSVAYKLKWANRRSSHRVMSPLEFMARLASIVAPPRLPLTRYHGVLAPNSSWRRAVVSGASQTDDDSEPRCAQQDRAKPQQSKADVSKTDVSKADVSKADVSKADVSKADVSKADVSKADVSKAEAPKPRSRTSTSYVPWSELMKRTLGINVLQCPVCQATMLLLAVITKREVIDRILTHVKVPREPVEGDEPAALYFDVTGESVPAWAVGVDPDERGPPTDWEFVDPPAPET